MFVLFGWGHTTRKDFGETFPMKCPNCDKKVFFRLLRVRGWFTLFFIPVFPYRSKHYLMCPVCTVARELGPSELEKVRKMNDMTQRFLRKEMTQKNYRKGIEKLGRSFSRRKGYRKRKLRKRKR